jgi:hypothetical protein
MDLLPPGHDRYVRHQLAFELVGAGALAVATGEWPLVIASGAILLPATRSTWVWWVRSGAGLPAAGVAVLAAAFVSAQAVAWVWLAASAIGIVCLWLRRGASADPGRTGGARRPRGAQRGPRTRT